MNSIYHLLCAGVALCLCQSAFAITVRVTDHSQTPLSNAVVTIDASIGNRHSERLVDSVQIRQKNLNFQPFVSVVPMNQTATFPNEDDVLHHVYSFSPTKRFEFALYGTNKAPEILLDKPGIVVLGCNIHDQMRGYIYVSEAPIYGVTGESGEIEFSDFEFDDNEKKEITLTVWHPDIHSGEPISMTRTIDIDTVASQTLEIPLEVKPRIRHAVDRFESGDYE